MLSKRSTVALLAAGLIPSVAVWALDVGLEGQVSLYASDNINEADAGLEEDGQLVYGSIGVFGSQKGRVVQGGFTGEVETRRRLDDSNDNFDALTRFIGAADIAITPRSIHWYVGDILAGVRADNGIQTIDDANTTRRNVFVTGPTFEYEIDSYSRTRAQLLYVNQSDEDGQLESLYNASASWEKDSVQGSRWGWRFGDVFTDNPDDAIEDDFNRANLSLFWGRKRGVLDLYGEVGATRYDTGDNTLNGASAGFTVARSLSTASTLGLSLSRDLRDQTLNTVESLIDDGNGEQPEADGFFDETRVELDYGYTTSLTTVDFGVGVAMANYRLLNTLAFPDADPDNEDNRLTFASAAVSHALTPRLRTGLSLSAQQKTYDNRDDTVDSLLAMATAEYSLSSSWSLDLGLIHDRADGTESRLVDGAIASSPVDTTENRVTLSLRWAPVTRADKDLTVQLKSLVR